MRKQKYSNLGSVTIALVAILWGIEREDGYTRKEAASIIQKRSDEDQN
jgi:hypothetical protein